MEKAKNALLILFGCVITGLAYALFLIPHHFVPGGVSGIAIILNYFAALPVGALIIVLNVPVFLLGLKTMGKKYVLNSLAGMVVSSVFIDIFNKVLKPLGHRESRPDLEPGRGHARHRPGHRLPRPGLDRRLRHHRHDPQQTHGHVAGYGIMVTDFVIISASGFALHSLEAPLYGYLVLFLSTKVIDMVLEGWNYSKLVIITSARTDEIADYILRGLDRSGTALRSRSLYLNREGELILTVIHRKQLADLRNFIKKTDPEAFVIINDTYDVLGKGFKSHLIT